MMFAAEALRTEPDAYLLVDAIPEAAAIRRAERQAAEAVLEGRRQGQQAGIEAMAPPVDALSTAHAVLRSGSEAERQERYQGLLLDCQRLVAEWYRKKKPEYFPPVRHYFDAESEEFFSHGLSVRQMTYNALLPIAGNREEEARRVNERVEDATPQILRKLGHIAVGSQVIRTISECTDKAIQDYEHDMANGAAHRGYDGYVPEIQKLMIRDIRLQDDTDDRFEEQVGVPGTYITHDIIRLALQRRGANVTSMDKTELHGSQFLAKDDLLGFVALLDEVASEQWCTDIFMGEEVPAGHGKDYDTFRQEALRRQEGLKGQAGTVAAFVLDLARDGTDRRQALTLVEDFVKKLLLDMAKQDTSVAEQMFDKRTAAGLQEVSYLESIGQYDAAFAKMQAVERTAPGGGYCGAGSCGLEKVNTASSGGKELAKALKAGQGDQIVKDKVRSCKCGSKSVVYAYNAKKVNKYCQNCKAFESKAGTQAA